MKDRRKGILQLCFNRTWITINDVVSLFIPNMKYAHRFMSKLDNDGLIKTVRVPMFNKKGKGYNFYSLSKEGCKELLGNNKGYRNPIIPTVTHLYHHYLINTFLTGSLKLSVKFPELISTSISEKELKKNNEFYSYIYERVENPESFLKAIPDFIFSIGTKDKQKLFIGEVDTGTETVKSASYSAKSIERKFDTMLLYQQYGIIDFFSKLFNYSFNSFSYLHVTTGNLSRIRYINAVANKVIGDEFDVFITSDDLILPVIIKDASIDYSSIISPVWYKCRNTFNEKKQSVLL